MPWIWTMTMVYDMDGVLPATPDIGDGATQLAIRLGLVTLGHVNTLLHRLSPGNSDDDIQKHL